MPTERPVADPVKLFEQWMDWERGDVTPGQTLANLKKGGLREILEALAEQAPPADETKKD